MYTKLQMVDTSTIEDILLSEHDWRHSENIDRVTGKSNVDKSVRSSKQYNLKQHPKLFKQVQDSIQGITSLPITLLYLLRYDIGDHFIYHYDTNKWRKHTICIGIKPEEYTGGELVLRQNKVEYPFKLHTGEGIIFDSTIEHKVNKVTSGVRFSIIGWTNHGGKKDKI